VRGAGARGADGARASAADAEEMVTAADADADGEVGPHRSGVERAMCSSGCRSSEY
jgi:hypothetical protein